MCSCSPYECCVNCCEGEEKTKAKVCQLFRCCESCHSSFIKNFAPIACSDFYSLTCATYPTLISDICKIIFEFMETLNYNYPVTDESSPCKEGDICFTEELTLQLKKHLSKKDENLRKQTQFISELSQYHHHLKDLIASSPSDQEIYDDFLKRMSLFKEKYGDLIKLKDKSTFLAPEGIIDMRRYIDFDELSKLPENFCEVKGLNVVHHTQESFSILVKRKIDAEYDLQTLPFNPWDVFKVNLSVETSILGTIVPPGEYLVYAILNLNETPELIFKPRDYTDITTIKIDISNDLVYINSEFYIRAIRHRGVTFLSKFTFDDKCVKSILTENHLDFDVSDCESLIFADKHELIIMDFDLNVIKKVPNCQQDIPLKTKTFIVELTHKNVYGENVIYLSVRDSQIKTSLRLGFERWFIKLIDEDTVYLLDQNKLMELELNYVYI